MKRITAFMIVLFVYFSACSSQDNQSTSDDSEYPVDGNAEKSAENVEVIADDLDIPWSIEKTADSFYLTERPGYIVRIENDDVERQVVKLEKEVATADEAGLLGFVLAPDFAESQQAYAYYTYENGEGQFNRIIMLHYQDEVWKEEEVLLDEIPSGSFHHGGRLKIGPDDKLYATTGDATEADIAQEETSLGGKILRLNLDGSIPDDNPFTDSYVFSLGHRNAQGMTWTTDETMYASEHGNQANDEVNQIEKGGNYGWPIIEGDEEREGLVSPVYTSGDKKTWAPSGMDEYKGDLYIAALRGEAILQFDLDANEYQEFITDYGRIRDIRIEGDTLYFISNNTDGRGNPKQADDKLYKLSLTEGE